MCYRYSCARLEFVSDVSDNQTCPETIKRTYRITDDCNNSINVTQDFTVNDTTAPILSNSFNETINITCEAVPEVPNLEFDDNCATTVSIDYSEITNAIDATTYSIIRTWEVSDDCNNISTFIQTINVKGSIETERRSFTLCLNDDPINLYDFITDTNNLDSEWSGDDMSFFDDGIINPEDVELGDYEILHTYVENGCIKETLFNINIHDDCVSYECISSTNDIFGTKMVTPNNDGNHDFFEVTYILNEENENLEDCNLRIELDIYNRWGTRVYRSEDYQNTWYGQSPGASFGDSDILPSGTYYYIINIRNSGLDPIQRYLYLGDK